MYHPDNADQYGHSIMKKILFILLTLLTSSVHSEVFKCQLKSGKTVYQSTPCEAAVKQEAIEIQKTDPRKIAEEEAKLKAWKEDFSKREQARIKAEKELQTELDRRTSVEALKKSAEYQQQQAREAKRQADALEQQNMQAPYQQYRFPSYYPTYQTLPTHPTRSTHQHEIKENNVTDIQRQTDSTTRKNTGSDSNTGKPKPLLWQ